MTIHVQPSMQEVHLDALKKQTFDQLAAVMLNAGSEKRAWNNGFDPDISEMLATDRGGFFDTERYPDPA